MLLVSRRNIASITNYSIVLIAYNLSEIDETRVIPELSHFQTKDSHNEIFSLSWIHGQLCNSLVQAYTIVCRKVSYKRYAMNDTGDFNQAFSDILFV